MKELLSLVDLTAEFEWRKKLWFQIGKAQVENTLRNCRNDCLLPFFRSCAQEGFEKDILEVLDQGKLVSSVRTVRLSSRSSSRLSEKRKKEITPVLLCSSRTGSFLWPWERGRPGEEANFHFFSPWPLSNERNNLRKNKKNTSKERLSLLLFKVWYFTSVLLIY